MKVPYKNISIHTEMCIHVLEEATFQLHLGITGNERQTAWDEPALTNAAAVDGVPEDWESQE